MAQLVQASPFKELRGIGTADGGFAVGTTPARAVLPLGTRFLQLLPRELATAEAIRVNLNPWLTILKTTDLLATKANLTDYSEAAQDGSTATSVVLSSLDTLANGGAVYIGSWTQFAGLVVDVDGANGTTATLAVTYSKNDGTFANITPTDGTETGGATFAQDGSITWTVPSDWGSFRLASIVTTAAKNVGIFQQEMFWVRLAVSAAMDSATTIDSIGAINRNTEYWELSSGLPHEQSITVGPGGVSSVTYLVAAGTASLMVNVGTAGRF